MLVFVYPLFCWSPACTASLSCSFLIYTILTFDQKKKRAFVLGWEPCIIFGSSHNHCLFFRCLYFFSSLLLWSLREPVPFLFILVSTFAGSPAMYIFDLLIHLHFDQKERALSLSILTMSGPGKFPRVESN